MSGGYRVAEDRGDREEEDSFWRLRVVREYGFGTDAL